MQRVVQPFQSLNDHLNKPLLQDPAYMMPGDARTLQASKKEVAFQSASPFPSFQQAHNDEAENIFRRRDGISDYEQAAMHGEAGGFSQAHQWQAPGHGSSTRTVT